MLSGGVFIQSGSGGSAEPSCCARDSGSNIGFRSRAATKIVRPSLVFTSAASGRRRIKNCAEADVSSIPVHLGDKGYDSKSNRDAARQRGICPAIPYRSNTKNMLAFFPKTLYKARARIEQAVGKLKRFKRIALRCEKTAQNYGSFVALALGFILIKSVHTA